MTKRQQWVRHKGKWKHCTECSLCEDRRTVVLLRGSIPASVLFVGEAPGESEDVLGQPFIGPAGKLLDSIIRDAGLKKGQYAITNLIACIPREENGSKLSVPPKESVQACADRLNECIEIVSPNLIVAVGSEAKKWLPKVAKGRLAEAEFIDIIHPAAILRMNASQIELARKRAIVTLADVIEGVGI